MNLVKMLIPNSVKSWLRAWKLRKQLASPYATPKALRGHLRGYKAFVQQERYVLGPPETTVAEFLAENVWRGCTCVDVGAHFGYYTLLMTLYAGDSGRIYAFEPQDDARAILGKNLAINDLQQVQVVSQVVAEKTGRVPWQDKRFLTTSRVDKSGEKNQGWKHSLDFGHFNARSQMKHDLYNRRYID